jgi:peptidase E
MPGHIVPMGAGRAVMDRHNDPLHDYVLELTGKADPVVLFLPTATGDDAGYIVSFYEAFHSGRCRPRHLRLFHRDLDDLAALVLQADVIHVGGGNTANMLDVWRRQGVDELLHRALAQGAVLTGGSAGGLCWFEGGTTDSFGPTLRLLHDGLGMIKGSYCPHYDAEDQRRPLFHTALLDGSLQMGYASGNRVAIRFTPDGEVVEAVTSEPGGRALRVYAHDGRIVEEDIPCRLLKERAPSRSVST